jgi:response regulator RpfG family c-di-GMP phosphodiesterase
MKQVLYLDDSHASIILVKRCLKDVAEVTGVNTLADARDLIEKNKYDVLLFDYQIGTHTSFELVEFVRKESANHQKTPIILVTAFRSEGVFYKGSKIGLNDYIFKPYEREAMLSMVTDYLNNPMKKKVAKPNHITAQCVAWNIGEKFYQYSPDLFETVEGSNWESCGLKMKERFSQVKKNAVAEIAIVNHTIPFFEE